MPIILRIRNAILSSRRSLAGAVLISLLLGAAWPRATGAQDLHGSVAVIEWEAPGDDGDTGNAARYELRYRATPVGTDTLAWWNAAQVVGDVPIPSAPGATDSVVVAGLDPSVAYWFVMRVADEALNWSGFSNVVVKPAFADVTPPATITDLENIPSGLLRGFAPELDRARPIRR